ncbi:MAG: (Fe-S)-binding protein [Armatimonadota bacterium]
MDRKGATRMRATREEYWQFSLPEKLLFYVCAIASIGYMGWQIWARIQLWMSGRPTGEVRQGKQYWMPTRVGLERWFGKVWTYILLQKKVRSSRPKTGAPMHLMMFYGFLALFVATTLLGINTYSPIKFHQGSYYLAYEVIFDTLGLLLLFGLVWAVVRRGTTKEPISKDNVDMQVLWLLLLITVNGYLLEAARIAINPQSQQGWDSVSWVGFALAKPLASLKGNVLAYKALWWFHALCVFAFFVLIPRLKLRHIVLAIFSAAGSPDTHMGKLRTIPMEEVEQTEQIGVKYARDYSRWHLMSLDACMECGRCTEVCPANAVGKILNPKQIVQDLRGAMASGAEVVPSLDPEALWQCTTCNACVEACPVLIRHVDIIVDARRNIVSEGGLSGSAALVLRQTASTGNAWGTSGNREEWMQGFDIPLARTTSEFEYLFWVGCAGATDAGAIKTTKAVADLLKKAGVSFACLGNEEACTGDPARRLGEEFLFQEKAMENVSAFERYGVKKIVTACPHCFNSLKNEYGDFDAKIEVFHHTQLLQSLVSKGKLLAAKPEKGSVVMHDPCYLGRVNDESEAPRALVEGMVNPEFHSQKTRCCGAGGGRMWMEEPLTERPSNARVEQLLATGAKTVALGCPFCKIMLDASVKQVTDEEINLVDLAEMLQAANSKTPVT